MQYGIMVNGWLKNIIVHSKLGIKTKHTLNYDK